MDPSTLDWHLDWMLGLLAALVALGVICAGLLSAILGTLKRIVDYRRPGPSAATRYTTDD